MGGDHKIPKVPNWRIYRVEDVPQLMNVRKCLASHNLKDPWLRNYVWYYTEAINSKDRVGIIQGMLKNWKYGLVAAIITTGLHKAYLSYTEPENHHGAHH